MKYCPKCRDLFSDSGTFCPKDESTLQGMPRFAPGTRLLNKYEIVSFISEGGMGAVYRARHLAFNEIRALKVIHSIFADDVSFNKRFKAEAIIARKLQHRNAIRIDDLEYSEDRRPFIVMELVEGETLSSMIDRLKWLPPERAIDIVAQVADALDAAHSLGIVHRDIKPENILIARTADDKDLPKVADLGIAKLRRGAIDIGVDVTLTKLGMFMGTPKFASPEQADGKSGDEIDGRADIYSLGVVLYVALTGEAPFQSRNAWELVHHHLNTVPVAPHIARPDLSIPLALSAVVLKAMEKKQEDRFQTASELSSALRGLVKSLPSIPAFDSLAGILTVTPSGANLSGTRVVSDNRSLDMTTRSKWPGKKWVVRLSVALVLISAVATAIIFSRSHWRVPIGSGQSVPHVRVPSPPDSGMGTKAENRLAGGATGQSSSTASSPQLSLASSQMPLNTPTGERPARPVNNVRSTSAVLEAGQSESNDGHAASRQSNKDVLAAIALGDSYLDRGDCDQAIKFFQRALKTHPKDASLNQKIADAQRAIHNGTCAASSQ
jgi:serine/threonine protein kinase